MKQSTFYSLWCISYNVLISSSTYFQRYIPHSVLRVIDAQLIAIGFSCDWAGTSNLVSSPDSAFYNYERQSLGTRLN